MVAQLDDEWECGMAAMRVVYWVGKMGDQRAELMVLMWAVSWVDWKEKWMAESKAGD